MRCMLLLFEGKVCGSVGGVEMGDDGMVWCVDNNEWAAC